MIRENANHYHYQLHYFDGGFGASSWPAVLTDHRAQTADASLPQQISEKRCYCFALTVVTCYWIILDYHLLIDFKLNSSLQLTNWYITTNFVVPAPGISDCLVLVERILRLIGAVFRPPPIQILLKSVTVLVFWSVTGECYLKRPPANVNYAMRLTLAPGHRLLSLVLLPVVRRLEPQWLWERTTDIPIDSPLAMFPAKGIFRNVFLQPYNDQGSARLQNAAKGEWFLPKCCNLSACFVILSFLFEHEFGF